MDLSMSLGIFKRFEHPAYASAYEKVREACLKFKKAMGTACLSLKHAEHCAAMRVPILLAADDDDHLAADARRWVETLRVKGD
jgi:2-keto-3-deoxy-L-rhamnonate aldolase RhmA